MNALIALILLVVALAAVAAWKHMRNREMHDLIARLLAASAAQTTVVGSVVTTITGLTTELKDALGSGDIDRAKAAVDAIEQNTADLAKAAAVNTDASAEVHADDSTVTGGTGDDDSAVDPANVTDAGGNAGGEGTAGAGSGPTGGAGTAGTGQQGEG